MVDDVGCEGWDAERPDRSAFVIGAGGGIGTAICRWLAPTSSRMVILGEDRPALVDVGRVLVDAGFGGIVSPVVADLRRLDEAKAAARKLAAQVASPRDVLAYNAGFSRVANLVDIADVDFDGQLAVNFSAAFFVSREVGRAMANAGGGRIVFVSSSGAVAVHAGTAVYDASKAALESLSRSLAVELGPSGVTSNVVRVGHVLSGDNVAHPSPAIESMRRAIPRGPGQPDDVGAAVRWLASDETARVSGAALDLDGGRSAQGPNSAMERSLATGPKTRESGCP